jgi:hypothetical protein
MSPKPQPRLPKMSAMNRLAGGLPRQAAFSKKQRAEGWLRRRRASMQPWRRGRVRPSTCRDLSGEL